MNLEQVLKECEENGKNVVVVGPSFCGKTSIIQETKNKMEKEQQK